MAERTADALSAESNRARYQAPSPEGRFGDYGGRFVAETLMCALDELERLYAAASADDAFQSALTRELARYVGRPTPLYAAERLTAHVGGARIYLKREDLSHTGAHKINNTVGQAMLAERMGKTRLIAETGAGQHGVATATVAAKLGLECCVYMGEEDIARQSVNVYRMKLLGAEVRPVASGSRTLKDAMNEAMRDWVTNVDTTHYIIGSVAGPHPYPMLVRDFQAVIGREARAQCIEAEQRLPDLLVACVGGGSNAMGLFFPFVDDDGVDMVGVEAGGDGLASGRHAAPLNAGTPGVLHGSRTYIMDDDDGQIVETHSISAGLDYPGRRSRTRPLEGHRARQVRQRHGRRSAGRVPHADPHRRHHAGARVEPRRGLGDGRGGQAPAFGRDRRQPLRARRQGHPHRRRHRRHRGLTMRRLGERFAQLEADGRKALNTFVTAGDPTPAATVPAMRALVRGGADIVELGVPFSDPEADGPTIQAASERALAHGVTLGAVLDMAAEFRAGDAATPVVLMGYLNQFAKMGYAAFCARAARSGVDGVIVVNMPPEECAPFAAELRAHGLAMVLLMAPTTTERRAALIAKHATGFVYYVSYKGITGAKPPDADAVGKRLALLRRHAAGLPVLVGFGIADGAAASRIAPHADGVVVGSALVRTMATAAVADIPSRLEAQAAEIRAALDAR